MARNREGFLIASTAPSSRKTYRFVIPPGSLHGATITLEDPQEIHHLAEVLRLRPGDRVVCFDGTGVEYTGTIRRREAQRLIIQVDRPGRMAQPRLTLWLAQALLKGERFDWLVQKATELGVTRISPVATARTVVRWTQEQGRARWARWQRIAREASKQCGRTTLPIIDAPAPFAAVMQEVERVPLMLMPTLAVAAPALRTLLEGRPPLTDVAALIGPEGDFTPEEVADAQRRGARPVSLGSLTLRSETAALAVLSILRYAA
ncbi:MAG: 16S rRNA (uracil(1498)-N(3))-methyltransferase [Candidatus Omnitrophota bacterium]|nr:16S rRNA (uracil(1498)-N(3))-methyltransferase [Candidatus Omnitrophota bacterium]